MWRPPRADDIRQRDGNDAERIGPGRRAVSRRGRSRPGFGTGPCHRWRCDAGAGRQHGGGQPDSWLWAFGQAGISGGMRPLRSALLGSLLIVLAVLSLAACGTRMPDSGEPGGTVTIYSTTDRAVFAPVVADFR